MPLNASDVFARLSEWSHRGVGTEEELEAREALITELTGEFEVDIKEEGFNAPTSYIPFLWLIGGMVILAVLGAGYMPIIMLMLMLGAVAFGSLVLFFDGRSSPLIWWGAQQTTANLVASKGKGDRLFILMAHIDSAPASFAYRPGQVVHFRQSIYLSLGLNALGVVVPLLSAFGISFSTGTLLGFAGLIVAQLILASMDFWRFGYTPGANDNLTGVAAATSAASHLWRRMPPGAEVRLVITSAEEAGMLGAQHYLQVHRAELKARNAYVINIDTVGCKNLRTVSSSGSLSHVRYDNVLTQTAHALRGAHDDFYAIEAVHHHVGDFDSVWFERAGIPAVTIASYDDDGYMSAIHTPDDTTDKVSLKTMTLAARFAEAIVRTCLSNK